MDMRYAPSADEAVIPWAGHLLTGKVKLCV